MRSIFVHIRFASLVASVAVTLIATSPARAQPMYAPGPPPRVGLELGVGIQAGNLFCSSADSSKCNGATAAGGINLDASWFANPRLGLTGDIWAMAHTENNFTVSQVINTIGLKYRLVPVLYVQAGIGAAHAALSYGNSFTAQSDDAFAVMGAIGLDVVRGRRFALSIEARAGTGFYGKNDNGQPQTEAKSTGIGATLTFFDF